MKRKNKLRIFTALLAVFVTLTGIAAANPWDLIIYQGSPNQNNPEPNDILVKPGVAHISSLFGQKFKGPTPETFPLNARVTCSLENKPPLDTDCHKDDVMVKINNVTGITDPLPSLGPILDINATFLAVDSVSITLKMTPQDPLGTKYIVTVVGGPGSTDGETASASRTVRAEVPPPPTPTPIPEFTAVALPIAAIMGLIFVISRRKQN